MHEGRLNEVSIGFFMGHLFAANDELPHLTVLEALLQLGLDYAVEERVVDIEVLLVEVSFITKGSLSARLSPQHY